MTQTYVNKVNADVTTHLVNKFMGRLTTEHQNLLEEMQDEAIDFLRKMNNENLISGLKITINGNMVDVILESFDK